MHPFFSVTIFTGQQLVLEALQRWLTRPCTDAVDVQRQRRGLKGLLSLLIKTTATGMLATVLDAAIEFRRRQLLAAAAAEPDEGSAAAVARFPGLGMLSRAGIASWKARLLMGIDELERRAHAYGIGGQGRGLDGSVALYLLDCGVYPEPLCDPLLQSRGIDSAQKRRPARQILRAAAAASWCLRAAAPVAAWTWRRQSARNALAAPWSSCASW
jgi:hypothetical protein